MGCKKKKNKKEVKAQEAGWKRRSREKSEMLGDYFGNDKKGILKVEFGDSVFMLVCLMHAKRGRKMFLSQGARRTMRP